MGLVRYGVASRPNLALFVATLVSSLQKASVASTDAPHVPVAAPELLMPMIPERERQQIREIFDRDLASEVRIEVFSKKPSLLFVPGRQESGSGPETEALVRELAELTSLLQVEVHDVQAEPEAAAQAGVSQVPAVLLHGTNAGSRALSRSAVGL